MEEGKGRQREDGAIVGAGLMGSPCVCCCVRGRLEAISDVRCQRDVGSGEGRADSWR